MNDLNTSFTLSLRGYNTKQVDEYVDSVTELLINKEAELKRTMEKITLSDAKAAAAEARLKEREEKDIERQAEIEAENARIEKERKIKLDEKKKAEDAIRALVLARENLEKEIAKLNENKTALENELTERKAEIAVKEAELFALKDKDRQFYKKITNEYRSMLTLLEKRAGEADINKAEEKTAKQIIKKPAPAAKEEKADITPAPPPAADSAIVAESSDKTSKAQNSEEAAAVQAAKTEPEKEKKEAFISYSQIDDRHVSEPINAFTVTREPIGARNANAPSSLSSLKERLSDAKSGEDREKKLKKYF